MSTRTTTSTKGRHVSPEPPSVRQAEAEDHAQGCSSGLYCPGDITYHAARHRKLGPAATDLVDVEAGVA